MISNPPHPPIICIDPGHSSEISRGTSGRYLSELHADWLIAINLRNRLKARGFRVVLTKRTESEFVTNRKRAEIANSAGPALMVRLHCDAASGHGFATYYPDRQGVSGKFRGPSQEFLRAEKPVANRFFQGLSKALEGSLANRGLFGDEKTAVGHQHGALIGSIFSKVPVVLVEMVVLTNARDEAFISSKAGQDKLAEGLAAGCISAVSYP